jgi:[acyl-carrier-protein] S-malonyltransferase
MQPAAARLRTHLEAVGFEPPRIDLINNVDVAIAESAAAIRDALVRQAASPVRWAETVQRMARDGVTHIVECGPGNVLAGLVRRIAPQAQGLSLGDRQSLEQALTEVQGA